MTETKTPYPELSVGPEDPDNTSELTRKLGVHNKAHKLLQRHSRNAPRALIRSQFLPRDVPRSDVAEANLDLIRDAALSVKGRKRFLAEDDVLEGASVRGTREDDRVIILIYRRPSGRSGRGMINYSAVPKLEALVPTRLREMAAEKLLGVSPGDAQLLDQLGLSGVPASPVIEAADSGDEQAQAAVAAAEEAQREAEGKYAELAERLERLENPEPFAGYDETEAKDIVERVKEGGVAEFGRVGLARIRDYEEADAGRVTILRAVEDALDAAPAADGG